MFTCLSIETCLDSFIDTVYSIYIYVHAVVISTFISLLPLHTDVSMYEHIRTCICLHIYSFACVCNTFVVMCIYSVHANMYLDICKILDSPTLRNYMWVYILARLYIYIYSEV